MCQYLAASSTRMSESLKKKRLTPAQKEKFLKTATSIESIKKFKNNVKVEVPM
jgi:hypothetical protein